MSRFLPAACVVAVLAVFAAGCSGGNHEAATTTTASVKTSAACKLSAAQRRTVAVASADIRQLRRIQAPVQSFSQRGAPGQNEVTGKLMLDLGTAKLPLNVYAHLIHLGKTAVNLCGACSVGLEGAEPVLGNRGRSPAPSCGA